MANPKELLWTGPSKNIDGSAFTSDQYGGFEIEVDGKPAVAVSNAWATDYQYRMDLALLELGYGDHSVRMRTVAKGGLVSDWTPALTFRIAPAPLAPTNLRVA